MLQWKWALLGGIGLAGAGLVMAYHSAVTLGVIQPIELGNSPPITCPVDPVFHRPPMAMVNGERDLAELLPQGFDRSKTSILIEKSKYRLTLYYDQKPVKSYAVVFGDTLGDKRQEGDRKTPEGILRIRDLYPHPDWAKFLWLDYPNAQSRCKHDRAKQQGEIPHSSSIGGEVGIHGVPAGRDAWVTDRVNWTLGCPALKNGDVEELYGAGAGGYACGDSGAVDGGESCLRCPFLSD